MTPVGAGVRYRLACGVRAAMRVWGSLLVAIAVAAGLEVTIPLGRWGAEWAHRAVFDRMIAAALLAAAIVILARPLLRGAMRTAGEAHVLALPLAARDRFAIDAAAIALFLSPLFVTVLVIARMRFLEVLAWCAVAVVVQTATLGATAWNGARPEQRWLAGPYEMRWLLRTGHFVRANVTAIVIVAATELAIRNNDVVRLHSIARIASLFAALAAGVLAAEIARARGEARRYRAIEQVFPIDDRTHVRSLAGAALLVSLPMLLAVAVLRPIAVPYAVATLVMLVLFAEWEPRLPAGASAAAALLAALDARVALLVLAALLPLAWALAVRTTRCAEVVA